MMRYYRKQGVWASIAGVFVLSLTLLAPPRSLAQDALAHGPGEVTNSLCPVIEGEAVDPEVFVDVDGQRVYFCCAMCRVRYQRDPEQYLEAVAEVMHVALGSDLATDKIVDPGSEQDDAHTDHKHDAAEEEKSDTGDGLNPGEHDHATDHDIDTAGGERERPEGIAMARLLGWVGRFHPATIHFPIAMLLGALLGEFLFVATGRAVFGTGTRFCLWIGAIGSILAAALGWSFGGVAWSDGDWVMTTHRWLGTIVPALALVTLVLREVWERGPETRTKVPYRVGLMLAAGAVGANGFLGGALIYGLDHYAF